MTTTSDRWHVYGGGSFNIWTPDTGQYRSSVDINEITEHLHRKRLNQHKTKRSAFHGLPAEVIQDDSTLPCRSSRIAFRDVARANDSRTLIAALVPGEVVLVDLAPYLLFVQGTARDEAYLLGVLSSMILDWYARRVVEMHVKFYLLNNFPIPPHYDDDPVAARVVEIAGRLAAVDARYAAWAAEVGVGVGTVTSVEDKENLACELDACVAHLYGLDEDDLGVVYDTFHTGADYSLRHAAVLAHFRNLPDIEPAVLRAERLAEEDL